MLTVFNPWALLAFRLIFFWMVNIIKKFICVANYEQFINSWIYKMSDTQSNFFIWQNLHITNGHFYLTVDLTHYDDLRRWQEHFVPRLLDAHVYFAPNNSHARHNSLYLVQFRSSVALSTMPSSNNQRAVNNL